MGRKILAISNDLLVDMLKDGHREYIIEGGLPEDSVLVETRKEFGASVIELVFESDSFEPCDDGCRVEHMEPPRTITIHRADACYACDKDPSNWEM